MNAERPTTDHDALLDSLLFKWEEAEQAGHPTSLEELCDGDEGLVVELRRRLEVLRKMDALLEVTTTNHRGDSGWHDLRQPSAPPPDIPGFVMERELGRGGMGVVYAARQTDLNRTVALKIIVAGVYASARERFRFRAEAEAVARLNHPGIVQIFSIGDHEGIPYICLEYIPGGSLGTWMTGQPLPVRVAIRFGQLLATAIGHAHRRGIVHRDLKPANVLLALEEDGSLETCHPKITDFSIARKLDGSQNLTGSGHLVGSPAYMAPEQAIGKQGQIGPATDIHGLGLILFEMLTARTPFVADSEYELLKQLVDEPAPSPSRYRPEVPRWLDEICQRCLAKDPSDRFASAADLANALSSGGWEESLLERRSPARRSRMSRRAAIGMGIAGTFGLATMAYRQSEGFPSRANMAVTAEVEPIRVGVLHSLTGPMAVSEQTAIDGTLLAIDEINQAGGILGRELEPVVEDGRSQPEVFATKARKLIAEDRVDVVFGGWTSASRKAMIPVIDESDHLLVYPVGFEGLEHSPRVLYTGTAPNQEIIPAVEWCYANLRKKRFFLVGSDQVYSHVCNEIIKEEIVDLGGTIVGEEYLPYESTDVTEIVEKIKSSGADVILNTMNTNANVPFFKALRAAGVNSDDVPTLSFSSSPQDLLRLDPDLLSGDYVAASYIQSIDSERNREFLNRLHKRLGNHRIATDVLESAYVGVHLWALAAKEAASVEPSRVRGKLAHQEFDAPGGRVTIADTELNTSKHARVAQFNDQGGLDLVWSSVNPIDPADFPATRTQAQWEAFIGELYRKWGNRWVNAPR
ncbi:Aliphatic amidase expression-regulating protein [Planctomycetes bacterium Pan216]|uniref:Aliphatic amidase expression-regulating protein n=1 Tax=Kolteria novifilia TaxID=2527975 RepID=A0A518B7R2_9BACT|nr:Aliphatic amidase expression-regulating protein [Planctomycetes bacterium Pan216]